MLFGMLLPKFAIVSLNSLQLLFGQLSFLHLLLYSQEEIFSEECVRFERSRIFFRKMRIFLSKVDDVFMLIQQKLVPFATNKATLSFNILLAHLHMWKS